MSAIHKEFLRSALGMGLELRASQVLSVGLDPNDEPCVWFVTGDERHEVRLTFTGSGAYPSEDGWRFVSTFLDGTLVLHAFARRVAA